MQQFKTNQALFPDSSADSSDSLAPGTEILGKYIVERTLGAGGMGFVVAARHKGLGRLDAIKFLLPQTMTSRETLERFEREAKATANLSSQHVARVYDTGFTDADEPYIVMEYLEGRDFKTVLQGGPLPVEEAVEYLLQVCHALAEAHDNGIVHRDLKPANLFLTFPKNAPPCVKVLDFGIAKIIGSNEKSDITANNPSNGLLGTIPYMSPEHLKGAKGVDARTDIWALGVIAYELLTAQKPFHGSTRVVLMSKILDKNEHPDPPSAYRPNLPRAIERVIGRCLAKDRSARYQTIREFETALREAAGIAAAPSPRAWMASIPIELPVERPPAKIDKTQLSIGAVKTSPTHWKVPEYLLGLGVILVGGLVVGWVVHSRLSNWSGPVAIVSPMSVVPLAVPIDDAGTGEMDAGSSEDAGKIRPINEKKEIPPMTSSVPSGVNSTSKPPLQKYKVLQPKINKRDEWKVLRLR